MSIRLAVAFGAASLFGAAQVITTVAGTAFTFPSPPLAALSAPLGKISGVRVDAQGNVYTADSQNNIVARISPAGVLTVVAGNGISFFSGDGGAATSASLSYPNDVAIDSAGNIYIADSANNRIREVSGGIITTVAGNGVGGYKGDGGPAINAELSGPVAIALDSAGNLYIADSFNDCIRKVSNGIITTVAGGGTGQGVGVPATSVALPFSTGVAVDPAGNIYIAETYSGLVQQVSGGVITTFAGGGTTQREGAPATSVGLSGPSGLAFDSSGNLYIADQNKVRKVSAGIITTAAGNGTEGYTGDGGPATSAMLNGASGVAVDAAGNIYIADSGNERIREVVKGTISTIAGNGGYDFSGNGGPAVNAALNAPSAVATDAAGNLYIADSENNQIRKVSGGIIGTIAGNLSPGFAGDGGPAANASLLSPFGLTVDSSGNIFIADSFNNRVREISGGTIRTVAGDGNPMYAGDGGPATSASLHTPWGVAVDSAGNLYIADYSNHRIRKVSGGIITTVAGNGTGAFAGDGGPATSASLQYPTGVALDAQGNLYIADTKNNRIREVSGGTITTVAGGGTEGAAGPSVGEAIGDGGAATNAFLNQPFAVAFDGSGNLYIADSLNSRIRMVSSGTITSVAGNGFQAFSGDGGLATKASLFSPLAMTLDPGGNLYIADKENDRIREIPRGAPTLSVSTTILNFEASSGGGPTQTQSLGVTASIPSVEFTVTITPSSAAHWLIPNYSAGATPLLLTFLADPTSLAPGTYSATVTVNAPVAVPATQTISVTFSVGMGEPPTLQLDKNSVSFGFPQHGTPRSQLVQVRNIGGGALAFTVTTATQSGGPWLSATPSSGTAQPGSPALLTITADPSGLQTGTYLGTVTVAAGSQSQSILVVASISALSQAILLGQAGLSFLAVSGGGLVPPQSFGVYNTGTGVMAWKVTTSTITGGAWLQATPDSGISDASSSSIPRVTVTVNPAGLAAGRYYGLVRVTSSAAANSPQMVTATLEVLPAGQDPGVVIQPAQLNFFFPTNFDGTVGPGSPSSQQLTIYDLSAKSTNFVAQAPLVNRALQFYLAPSVGTVAPQTPAQITVQPALQYPQNTTLTIQFSDGTLHQVPITLTTGLPSSGSQNTRARDASPSGCTPQKLVPTLSAIGELATHVNAGWPTALSVSVMDDCGQPQTVGSVVVSFSNGDPPIPLQSSNDGNWEGTWQNSYGDQGQVTISIVASDPARSLSGSSQTVANLLALEEPPVFAAAGVVNNADPVSNVPLGLGSIVSIYGNQLSATAASFTSAPLSTALGSAQVFIGGEFAPLYYASPTLINLQVPYDIEPDTAQQIVIQKGNTLSVPVTVNVAQAQPASFLNTSIAPNAALAYVLRNGGGFVATPSSPAQAGDELILYFSGLGPVGQFSAGEVAPLTSTYETQNPVTVTIGGVPVTPDFAGLAPTFIGLYQINVRVPANVPTGMAVPLTVQVLNLVSPTVTISVE